MADETGSKWTWIWAAIAITAIAAAVYLYLHPKTVTVTRTEFKQIPQIQRVVDVQRVYVPGPKQVVVLKKDEVASKLDMPWLQGGDIERAKVAESPAPTETVAGAPTASAPPTNSAPVAGDPRDLEVTATADIPESDNGMEAVSILNTKTGESSLIVQEKASPWLEFESGIVAGLRYGLNTGGEQTGTAYAGWEFLRIKDLHLIGYTEINTNVEGKIQLDLQYRRR